MALLGFSYFAIKSGYEAFLTAVILIFIGIKQLCLFDKYKSIGRKEKGVYTL